MKSNSNNTQLGGSSQRYNNSNISGFRVRPDAVKVLSSPTSAQQQSIHQRFGELLDDEDGSVGSWGRGDRVSPASKYAVYEHPSLNEDKVRPPYQAVSLLFY